MPAPLRVLLIEDSETDALLVSRELRRNNRAVESALATNAAELTAALPTAEWDIVLSDFALPGFDANAALDIVRSAMPDVPFVVISGTIGEERAVELLRQGVADYVLKDNLSRLNAVVDRAIRDAQERHELSAAEERLLLAGEQWHKTFDAISDAVILAGPTGRVSSLNEAALALFDVTRQGARDRDVFDLLLELGGERASQCLDDFRELKAGTFELGPCGAEGRWFDVSMDAVPGVENSLEGWVLVLSDITERKRSEGELRSLVAQLERSMRGSVSIAAHMVEKRDPYTAGHQSGVAEIAVEIAQGLGMSVEEIELIRTASILHDIGKIAVPAEILVKPGRLDEYEWLIIQRHPQVGAEILEDAELGGPIAEIIRQHHERLDGSGYPRGLTDEDICLEARIIAVADVAEAMLAHRPYRPARTIEETRGELLRGRGTLYDPRVVDACLAALAVRLVPTP